ncbi:rho gtpase 2 [Anaeramoeba ignava]|uniref:Mitochondrial Rho GTPase n=1 Tax=Anaeramoeba ignava TaxID=1746090 RepID=A0A9Q0LCP6_ANAIG|nr:rho gtpase 2 [Anaeramoeba ignava]
MLPKYCKKEISPTDNINICFIGDDGVGKTTLINTFIIKHFPLQVPDILLESKIPKDSSHFENILTIMDTTTKRLESMYAKMSACDVLCLLYSKDNYESFFQVENYWIPLIKKLNLLKIPIILIETKADLKSQTKKITKENIETLLRNEPIFEFCASCSSRELDSVDQVFYMIEKSCIYPRFLLYDLSKQNLTKKAVEVFQEIFNQIDQDKDNLLSNQEISKLESFVFQSTLKDQEVQGILSVIKQNYPNGITNEKLNFQGFLFLMKIFIENDANETTWMILNKFNFRKNLTKKKHLNNLNVKEESGKIFELNSKGIQFLLNLFKKHDQDNDGALSRLELKNLFEPIGGIIWPDNFQENSIKNDSGNLTLTGFLSQWQLSLMLDPQLTINYLHELGLDFPTLDFISVCKNRNVDFQSKQILRNVLVAFVIGKQKTGKSSILNGLIGNPFDPTYIPTTKIRNTINEVDIGGRTKYLILCEIPEKSVSNLLKFPDFWKQCDIICLVYEQDNMESFYFIEELLSFFEKKPCILIQNKTDLSDFSKNKKEEIQKIFEKKKIKEDSILKVSMKTDQHIEDFYTKIAKTILNRWDYIITQKSSFGWGTGLLIGIALVITVYQVSKKMNKKK